MSLGDSPNDSSGTQALIGYASDFMGEDGGRCRLAVGPQHLNRSGVVHGGLVAMLLDNGCGLAVRNSFGDPERNVLTLSLTVNYLAPARAGTITAIGRVTGGGSRTKYAQSELRDEAGTLLATASGVFKLMATP